MMDWIFIVAGFVLGGIIIGLPLRFVISRRYSIDNLLRHHAHCQKLEKTQIQSKDILDAEFIEEVKR